MTCLRLALVLAAALFFDTVQSAPAESDATALAADDECSANDGAACALNELQLKAKAHATEQSSIEEAEAQSDEDRQNRTADDDEISSGVAKWYLGRVGESCTQACSSHRMTCSPNDFKAASSWQQVWSFAEQAGAKCSMSWANDNRHGMGFTAGAPEVCKQSRCGSDMAGTCAYDPMPRSTCDGLPATGFQRLCPCGASSSGSWPWSSSPRPAPAPHSVPVPAPGYGSWGAPSPYPHPASATTCKSDTGGTCSWMSCAKSRGVGVTCAKSGGKHKCVCKPGYCSVKGVCKKASR